MFEIKVTFNGKPLNQVHFRSEFEKDILQAAAEQIVEDIMKVLTREEAKKITLDFRGNIDNFAVNIDGDDAIVDKAAAALED